MQCPQENVLYLILVQLKINFTPVNFVENQLLPSLISLSPLTIHFLHPLQRAAVRTFTTTHD